MPTLRAFIAIELDPSSKQKISTLISQLKASNADIKWITELQMHLTLKFLGNIQQDMAQKISYFLKDIAKGHNAFTIRFSNIGAFPNMKRPRVIWLGIDKGSDALKQLNQKIETELEHLAFNTSTSLGAKREKRDYKAHLTLGRVKSLKNISELTNIVSQIKFQPEPEIKIDKVVLFQSTLTPKGAVYTSLSEHMF